MSSSPKIGVVLSSGGGRGVFAHTGFLQALEQIGINISAITGCSAGALVGGIYASGTDIDQWSNALANVHTSSYWAPDSWPRFLWNMVVKKGRGYTGFSSCETAIEFIRDNLQAQNFEDCRIPYYSLAMNLAGGTKTLFSHGELAPRIMASAAIPVLYRPVQVENEFYCDGALIELAPTEAICCLHDLDLLLVHHTSIRREGAEGVANALQKPWSLLEILYLLIYRHRPWYLSDQPLSFTHCRCSCHAPIIVLEPDLPEMAWPHGKGGAKVQAAALQQTLDLLTPHRDKLVGS